MEIHCVKSELLSSAHMFSCVVGNSDCGLPAAAATMFVGEYAICVAAVKFRTECGGREVVNAHKIL